MATNGFEATDPRAKNILIVDDDDGIRNLLEVLVSSAGFKVMTAETGEQAIEKLKEKPDAVLLDLIMPGCGGLGVLKHLKAWTGPLPAVLVFSAYENRHPSVLEAVMDPNVAQFLSKPIKQEVLLEALHRYVKTEPLDASAAKAAPALEKRQLAGEVTDNKFFEGFRDDSKMKLTAASLTENYPDGTELFAEGDPAEWVYLVCDGQVDLFKKGEGGRSAVLASVSAGDCFGEIGILDDGGRNVGARTKGHVTLKKISCADVRRVLEAEPAEVSMRLLKRVLHYLRVTNERVLAEIVRKEKMQLVGEMAGTIIHDFKNPLSGVELAAQMITRDHQDAATASCCKIIQQQTGRMLGMAQDLLDFSHGQPKLDLKKMSVAVLFDTFRQLNAEYLKKFSVRLNVAAAQDAVNVDLDRFLRVLQNLTGNAVDAIGAAGGDVFLESRQVNGGVEISVRDTGSGIPEAIRSRIFEPFFTFGKKHGTGLGMPIAKALVEAHGGQISFSTEMGKGTTFRVQLPSAG